MDEIPELELDDVHNHAANQDAVDYVIAAARSVVLHPGYFQYPEIFGRTHPTCIRIVGGGRQFRAEWDGAESVLLSGDNLDTLDGGEPFGGFSAGIRYVIGVGVDDAFDVTDAARFHVMWATILNVDAGS